jgi:ABC-2 type transport system ATP-binding protein
MKLIEVSGLSKHYGKGSAVGDLSFSIDRGHCVALLGLNGAGKTTTLKMLAGLLAPSSGTIRFNGDHTEDRRELIGYLPQELQFFNWMSGKEYLVFAARLTGQSPKEAAARAEETLVRVGLKDAANRRIGGYSGGMKQRLGLAQAVIHRPKLIILDEPVSALDPQGRREMLEWMRELKKETTILFSTHVLHDAEELCDDVLIMHKGRIVLDGHISDVMETHRQPLIRIRVEASGREWAESLRSRTFVKELASEGNEFKLRVSDISAAREALFREIAGANVGIELLEVGTTTLEDSFLKAVNA